jgi:endonuclease G
MPEMGTQQPLNLEEALDRVSSIASSSDELEAGGLESVADFGRYTGLPPQVALLDDGRVARLLAPISFVRTDQSEWPVPAGAELDGASIPRAFWTLIGGPFEGRYRNASIVHDHFCVIKTRPWRDTHRMFHDAMRCSEVSRAKAKIMFYAVYRFGPRWGEVEEGVAAGAPAPAPNDADAVALVEAAKVIAEEDPSLSEIETMADDQEAARGP